MNKIHLFLAILILSVSKLQAQLRVDTSGETHAKSLSIYQDLGTSADNSPVGIFSQIDGIPSSTKCAIKGYINGYDYAHLTKTSIGVQGYACECYGYNYGVLGSVPYASPITLGAAIYGTTNYTITPTNMLYAGFFEGDVHVTGCLTATGTLNASLLSGALPQSSSRARTSAIDALSENVSSLLVNIQVGSYYHNQDCDETPQTIIDLRTHQPASEEVVKEQNQRKLEQAKKANSRKHYGISADDLEEIFPDLVYENKDGSKSINYVEMVPILVQAINELTAKVVSLEGNETALKRSISSATKISSSAEELTMLSLGQNKPNPFGETTSIAVSVPEDVQSAFLYVYNLNGNKVAQVDITTRGKTSVSLSAANLSEGMYLYSLVADGKIVQTRRMIVEK